MNIILDASVLGIGFYHRKARTGISRVIEQLIVGLQQAADVELFLVAPTHLPETMRYAQSTFGTAASSFAHGGAEQFVARFENSLLRPFRPDGIPSKVIREVAFRTRRAIGREKARLSADQLPGQGVYHAPFFPIPEGVRNNWGGAKVQSIYDLIPIIHPEWFTDGEQTVKNVLATLPPDAWVTTISQATKDDFCAYTRFDPSRVVPILLAASPSLFYPVLEEERKRQVRTRLGIGDNPYLLSLATLEPRKNIAHLIRCFGQLVDGGEVPAEMRLVLVGTKGWKFDDVLAEASRNTSLSSRLIFTGFVPDEELAPLYSGATGFVYPSLYEGFGLPPLEAMQCGLPTIVSDIPALTEVVADAAIRVPPTDTDALCQAMLTVIRSESTRAALSRKAVERASFFSWDKFTAEYVALYKRISQ